MNELSKEGKIKVLFLDDEEDFLELAEKFFEKKETRIEADYETSPEKALDMLEEKNYDAAVVDYEMPKMDGLEVLETLRSRGDDIPFIFLTGQGKEEVAMEALNKGADRYHRKEKDMMTQFKELAKSIVEETIREKSETELETFQTWIKSTLSSESEDSEMF